MSTIVEALRLIVDRYDAYRRRGVSPAPTEYADVVEAIESARAALRGAALAAQPAAEPAADDLVEIPTTGGHPLNEMLRAGHNTHHNAVMAAETMEMQQQEIQRQKKAGAWCEKHKPYGGARSVCVICSCVKLQSALSRISYLCGPANEMECGPYDLHCDEDAVVEQVKNLRAENEALKDALKGKP
jgi:hypothetical protein